MLLRVIVENFLSYKERQEFTMFPNRDITELPSHIFDKDTIPLLKMASLYGNNASGKSNFAQALSFVRLFALSETTIQSSDVAKHLYRLEQLDKLKESSLSILIEFKSNGAYFIYQVELDLQGVRTEQLLLSGANKTPESLYRRQYSNIELSPSLSSKSLDQWSHTKGILEKRLTQDPYKSVLGLLFEFPVLEEKHIKQAYDWFQQYLVVTSGRVSHNQLNALLYESKNLYRFTSQVIRGVDIGVDDLRLRETDLAIWLNQHSDLANTLDMSRRVEASEIHSVVSHLDRPILNRINVAGKEKILELVFAHQGGDGNTYDLDIESESDGTIRTLHLMPALFEAINSFGVVVIDEMDTSLHSNLLLDLIAFFSLNPSKGQLIFTLHDTNLLDSIGLLRTDEVWFIEKRGGSSYMYSLDNYTKKMSGDISQKYREGRYGSNYTGNLVQDSNAI